MPGVNNEPELLPGLEIFLGAWHELHSSRQIGDSGDGPIPPQAIAWWCDEYEIGGELRDSVRYHVRSLDNEFLDWQRKTIKAKHDAAQRDAKKGTAGGKKRR
jgi:hypothetical protein